MRRAHAIRLAMAAVVSLLSSVGASACMIPWFCHADPVYAPMRIPLQDPRPGPVWTSNGWVYRDMRVYAEAPPSWPADGPRELGRDLAIEPPLERPIGLK